MVFCSITTAIVLAFVASLASYFVPMFAVWYFGVQNLKEKYQAKWALVTGSSSGIGKALAVKLADQGINVVLAALDDSLLKDTHKEMTKKYPKLSFRAVGVDLSKSDGSYMKDLEDATKDIHIDLLFNNAGYIVTSFFDRCSIDAHVKNIETNSTSAVRITHHYYTKMIEAKKPGAIVFTSSPAGLIPTPFAVMYGSTKAFLSEFVGCLAVEAKPHQIDVMAIHPSPVNSRFLDKAAKISMFDLSYKFAVKPEALPDLILSGIGRVIWLECGAMAMGTRLAGKFIDFNAMAWGFSRIVQWTPDYKKQIKSQ